MIIWFYWNVPLQGKIGEICGDVLQQTIALSDASVVPLLYGDTESLKIESLETRKINKRELLLHIPYFQFNIKSSEFALTFIYG